MTTVLPVKSDSGVMFCLQSYQGHIIDRSLVYYSYPIDSCKLKKRVQARVLLNNCKQNITSLSLLVGKTESTVNSYS